MLTQGTGEPVFLELASSDFDCVTGSSPSQFSDETFTLDDGGDGTGREDEEDLIPMHITGSLIIEVKEVAQDDKIIRSASDSEVVLRKRENFAEKQQQTNWNGEEMCGQ